MIWRRASRCGLAPSALQRSRIESACVDMWDPYTKSILKWVPDCKIVFDKFHVMQHANQAVDEVWRAEFFRKGGWQRGFIKGKRWLLLTRWYNPDGGKRRMLNELFRHNRRMMKAYLLKESLDRMWIYTYEGAARPGIPQPALPPAEGSADGGFQDRIRGHEESSLRCGVLHILDQSGFV